ncbi:Uncharacterised protein [uncultured Eubacterium sp.]|nr:Uncharacterised protein [uncultured Eubacterium sp.]
MKTQAAFYAIMSLFFRNEGAVLTIIHEGVRDGRTQAMRGVAAEEGNLRSKQKNRI